MRNVTDSQVLSVVDKEMVPIPEADPLRNYVNKHGLVVEDTNPGVRPLLPLQITQPLGPSFKVEGYHVAWDKWSFRVGFTPKEGLVLHTVSMFDPDKNRMRCVPAVNINTLFIHTLLYLPSDLYKRVQRSPRDIHVLNTLADVPGPSRAA